MLAQLKTEYLFQTMFTILLAFKHYNPEKWL